MVGSATRAAVCRTSAAPDGTHRRGPCHQHCSPSAVTVRHPQPHDSRHTRAAEPTIYDRAMAVATQPAAALRWDGRALAVLDQTQLPAREIWLELTGAQDTAAAIRRLAVRGAPLIGIVAAY